jgi:hypothetical protein
MGCFHKKEQNSSQLHYSSRAEDQRAGVVLRTSLMKDR